MGYYTVLNDKILGSEVEIEKKVKAGKYEEVRNGKRQWGKVSDGLKATALPYHYLDY